MKLYKSIFLIIAALALVIILTLKIYYSGEDPLYSGKIELIGIVDTVEIYTDEYGLPNIYAKNNKDLFFTSGYLVARERLFQLSLIHAIVNGNITDILGNKYLNHDQYIKKANIFGNIDTTTISDNKISLLQSYCDGINSYIENNATGLPISFKLTDSQPLQWTVRDVILTLELMSKNNLTEKNGAFIQTAVSKYFGESRAISFDASTSTVDSIISLGELQLEYEIMELIGANSTTVGPLATVVPAERSKNGKPILVLSDFWGYRHPTKWFDISLKGGDYDVSGSCVAGFPLPLVGGCERLVFAFTNILDELNINEIFELAKDNLPRNIQNLNSQSLCWADTAGNYFININDDEYFDEIEKQSELDAIEISKLLHSFKNQNKSSQINRILSYYNSDNGIKINRIRNWDGNESENSSTALLVNTIYKNLIDGIFKDELTLVGEDIYNLFLRNTTIVEATLESVIANAESAWLDNINTINYTESLGDVVNEAVDKSISEIRSKHGNTSHTWAKISSPIFKHILSDRKATRVFINFNTSTSSRKGVHAFLYTDDFTPVSTVALTKIFDLSNSGAYYSRLLPGQSGIPSSAHYSDQLDLSNKDSLRKIVIDDERIKNSKKFQRLILYPKK